METVKKNWPQVLIGVVAIAAGLYVIKRNSESLSKQKVHTMVVDCSSIDKNVWPQPRRIIDCNADLATQQKQLDDWLKDGLQVYIEKHGNFQVDSSNNLKEQDFVDIYDLIESVGRFQLQALRSQNENNRKTMFQKSFIDINDSKSVNNARRGYIDKIYEDIMQEINLYKDVQDQILAKVKINETIWNQSMEAYLPEGEQYITKALKFSMSSPFTYDGGKNSAEITKIYQDASDFAISLITKGHTPKEKNDENTNFKSILTEVVGVDDEQDKLIVLDYLVIDYVIHHHNMGSSQIKSAISAYNLLDTPDLQNSIKTVVKALQ